MESPSRAQQRPFRRPGALIQREKELEYIHRRIFVGTASLDDLLEFLDLSSGHTTTRHAVVKAFIMLSSNEQIHMRQRSSRERGWDLVTRINPNDADAGHVVQGRVKLGSITLQRFLDLIPFDAKDEVAAIHAVEAFMAASHIDRQAGSSDDSKGRAFRSWMVKTMEKEE